MKLESIGDRETSQQQIMWFQRSNFNPHFLVICIISIFLPAHLQAESRVWTNVKGDKLPAELVKFENDMVTLAVDGKHLQFHIGFFSEEDQDFIYSTQDKKMDANAYNKSLDQERFRLGKEAQKAGDHKEAIEFFEPLIVDMPAAQVEMGLYHIQGKSVPKDINAGLTLLKKAADNDHPEAHYLLGYIYNEGEIVEKDQDKALFYLRSAASEGVSDAQLILASILAKSWTLEDTEEAILWVEKVVASEHRTEEAKKLLEVLRKQQALHERSAENNRRLKELKEELKELKGQ